MSEKYEIKQSYCLKCRSKQDVINEEIKQNKRGNYYISGNCKSCGTKCNRFTKKQPNQVE